MEDWIGDYSSPSIQYPDIAENKRIGALEVAYTIYEDAYQSTFDSIDSYFETILDKYAKGLISNPELLSKLYSTQDAISHFGNIQSRIYSCVNTDYAQRTHTLFSNYFSEAHKHPSKTAITALTDKLNSHLDKIAEEQSNDYEHSYITISNLPLFQVRFLPKTKKLIQALGQEAPHLQKKLQENVQKIGAKLLDDEQDDSKNHKAQAEYNKHVEVEKVKIVARLEKIKFINKLYSLLSSDYSNVNHQLMASRVILQQFQTSKTDYNEFPKPPIIAHKHKGYYLGELVNIEPSYFAKDENFTSKIMPPPGIKFHKMKNFLASVLANCAEFLTHDRHAVLRSITRDKIKELQQAEKLNKISGKLLDSNLLKSVGNSELIVNTTITHETPTLSPAEQKFYAVYGHLTRQVAAFNPQEIDLLYCEQLITILDKIKLVYTQRQMFEGLDKETQFNIEKSFPRVLSQIIGQVILDADNFKLTGQKDPLLSEAISHLAENIQSIFISKMEKDHKETAVITQYLKAKR